MSSAESPTELDGPTIRYRSALSLSSVFRPSGTGESRTVKRMRPRANSLGRCRSPVDRTATGMELTRESPASHPSRPDPLVELYERGEFGVPAILLVCDLATAPTHFRCFARIANEEFYGCRYRRRVERID